MRYFKNYPHLEPIMNDCIKIVLEPMMESVDFNRIVEFIARNYGDIPFKNFKENFVSVLSRFSYQKNILKKAIDLLNSDIKLMTQELL